MQHELARALFNFSQWHLVEQRDWILIKLPPARRIEIAKETGAIVVPAPPYIARQLPQLFLRRRDEAIECPRLAHNGRHLPGCFNQHADLIFAKRPLVFSLNHEHALQNAAIDERHAEEGLILRFAGLLEELVAGMIARIGNRNREQQLSNQSRKPFVDGHAKRADGAGMKADGCRQHQVRAVGLKQVG
jgi:hypothetical protein